MKTKKILAYLLAMAMVSTSAVAVFAEGEEETTTAPAEETTTAAPEQTTTTEAPAPSTAPEITTVEGVVYNVYAEGFATVAKVTAEKESIYILDSIGGIPVAGVEADAFSDASKLKSITVSTKNGSLRAIDGCLYGYTTTKDKNDKDVYHDTLLAVPAAKASFQLSAACEWIWDDTDSVFPNNKVVGNVAKDHGTFIVVSGKLHDYTTETETTANADGTYTSKDKVIVGALYDDSIKWAVNGTVATPGDSTAAAATGDEAAPKTGSAGVGVALATLLAAGSTAVVLRKRGKRS